MTGYIIRRFLWMVPVMLMITVVDLWRHEAGAWRAV